MNSLLLIITKAHFITSAELFQMVELGSGYEHLKYVGSTERRAGAAAKSPIQRQLTLDKSTTVGNR